MKDTRRIPGNNSGQPWPRPVMYPLPAATAGVQQPVLSLNGTWKLNLNPPSEFWTDAINPASWPDVAVPGFTETQGFMPAADQEYAYRRTVSIPADFAGKRILLRFDGTTGVARVWVNGAFVRSHYGGFTSWYADITALVSPGSDAELTVGVVDKPREISPFNQGGMIRDVRLIAVPADCLTRLQVKTDLDADYRDATLTVTAAMAFAGRGAAQVRLELQDAQGHPVPLSPNVIALSPKQTEASIAIPMTAPQTWDAEHPNLYTLKASVVVGGTVVERVVKKVGVRTIEVRGNQLFVNNQEVKLRGVNRHDMHPKTGHTVTPDLVRQDATLFRAGNINFVRTSHYPPREDFLEVCDELGIYVEDEIAVAFVYQSIQPTENDPDFAASYMEQFAEMIERDQSHACVLMWSLANECNWGRNFQLEYDHAKAEDPTRPVIFSYPITMPEGTNAYDIWSNHYADWDCDSAELGDGWGTHGHWEQRAPVLHDEYAHIPCYDLSEQRRDPGIRDFYGESIKRFWESIFTTKGALGGAIWGAIDHVMLTPERMDGRYQMGIIDGWRRQKPEYWVTKKAYSPIRVAEQPLAKPGPGQPLQIPIKNWFDHTNLREITVQWTVGSESGATSGPDVAPHSEGKLQVAARRWQDGEVLNLKFLRSTDLLVDEFNLPIGAIARHVTRPRGPAPRLAEDQDAIHISGDAFEIVFSKSTALITSGTYKGCEIIKSGPYFHLVGVDLAPWTGRSIGARVEGNQALLDIRGSYGPVEVRFAIAIDGHGLMKTSYTLDKLTLRPPRRRRLRVGTDVGGYREVGVSYILSPAIDTLSWDKKGLWSAYPADHVGRNSGTAHRTRQSGVERFGEAPTWPWAEDTTEYFLFGRYDVGGRGTNDFRSMKSGIWQATAGVSAKQVGLCAESDGTDAVRLEVLDHPQAKIDDHDPAVHFVGSWLAMDGEPGSYHGTEMYSNKTGDYAEFTFRGTGIAWIGSRDLIMGKADVYVDGHKEATEIDLSLPTRHGSSRGEEKSYQEILFSRQGLAEGQHTIKVVVTGKKNARSNNSFVSVDAFLVLGTAYEGDVCLNINNAWNYPELTWGNWVKEPILLPEGYSNQVTVRLADLESA